MTEFLLAFAVFLLAHALPTRPPIRRRLVERLGERPFQLVYSAVSLVLLAWLVHAAIGAPYVELWGPAAWQVHLALALMPLAAVLVAVGLGVPNPRSVSLWPEPPGWRPTGVLRLVRHPLLVGLALWGGLHALANGALVPVLLFGGLAVFALAGMPLVARRRREPPGPAGNYRDGGRQVLAAAVGLAALLGVLLLHPRLFGVDPLAWLAVAG